MTASRCPRLGATLLVDDTSACLAPALAGHDGGPTAIRIMPRGDSITLGTSSKRGYRVQPLPLPTAFGHAVDSRR